MHRNESHAQGLLERTRTKKRERVELFLEKMRFGRPVHAGFAIVAMFAAIMAGCGHPRTRAVAPVAPARIRSTETGIASWYGIPYDGRRTASGEVYDMRQLTAAHRDLPFQTWVRVENLTNGKRVEVRINDRGPFVRDRIIDLSQNAAGKIGMLGPGIARVRLTVIARPANVPLETSTPRPASASPSSAAQAAAQPAPLAANAAAPSIPLYAVQAGSFADRDSAEAMREKMNASFTDARTLIDTTRTPALWRVLVGREMTIDRATDLADRVRTEAGAGFVVPEPIQSPQ